LFEERQPEETNKKGYKVLGIQVLDVRVEEVVEQQRDVRVEEVVEQQRDVRVEEVVEQQRRAEACTK
jgi:hypothetical protein